MNESSMTRLSVQDRVIDTEDDDPSVGVVVWRPSEMTIADWEFPTDAGQKTAAETNPDYAADSQLVIVAFEDDLNGYWDGWRDAESNNLFQGVRENGVHHYGFPEPRLAPADESEIQTREDAESPEQQAEPPEQFEPIIERLEQNDFSVAYDADAQELYVEKFGVEHIIDHDGTVQGESGIKSRVESIVNRFL